ncbi:LuxR family transcriptional regulator [Thermobifida halotolerans]|uniref:LuxR family transcriptional regulator n=1 Tax=Thermobifida halotolerans TaxID=483545 RepID=A0AA97M192_9ACTN|nr:LuxR family transcriptional regulator [Thermobifida halotolerans]
MPDPAPLLARAVRDLRRESGLPVAFGGPVTRDGRGFVIDQLCGTRTRSLLSLRVDAGAGLGGRALELARPWVVDDYFASDTITHVYDHAVAPERLRSIVAMPVRVGGSTRAVLYAASRRPVGFGDRGFASLARVVQRVERDFEVEGEVQRRLAAALSAERDADRGAPAGSAAELDELLAELSDIAETVGDEDARRRLVEVCRRARSLSRRPPADRRAAPRAPAVRLSPREVDVLAEVAVGRTNDEVAAVLGLLPNTVKSYLKSAMRKLDATNRVQAVHRARETGLLGR